MIGKRYWIKLGIPEKYFDIEIENYLDKLREYNLEYFMFLKYEEIISYTKEWLKKNRLSGLFLKGVNGCGKTALAIAVAKKFLEKKKSFRRITMTGLYLNMLQNFNKIPVEILKVDLLVLDEIAKEPFTNKEITERVFEYILKNRYERNKQTILISNVGLEELRERYGDTIYSVIKGSMFPLSFPDVDLRILEGVIIRKKLYKKGGKINEKD